MGENNGKGKVMLEELKETAGEVREAVKEADLGSKLDRLLDLIEDNAGTVGAIAKRVATETMSEVEQAAHATGDAIDRALEVADEEVIVPTVRYGRGLRHGILLGALIALAVTPWEGRVFREKVSGWFNELKDMIDAFRTGAAEG